MVARHTGSQRVGKQTAPRNWNFVSPNCWRATKQCDDEIAASRRLFSLMPKLRHVSHRSQFLVSLRDLNFWQNCSSTQKRNYLQNKLNIFKQFFFLLSIIKGTPTISKVFYREKDAAVPNCSHVSVILNIAAPISTCSFFSPTHTPRNPINTFSTCTSIIRTCQLHKKNNFPVLYVTKFYWQSDTSAEG